MFGALQHMFADRPSSRQALKAARVQIEFMVEQKLKDTVVDVLARQQGFYNQLDLEHIGD